MSAAAPASANRRAASKTVGGGLWTLAERVLSQASQLLIFIVAARLLAPAEFGVFALVSACAMLLLRVSEMGWAPYIMSWSGNAELPRQVLFVAALCGLAMGALGCGAGVALPAMGLISAQTGDLVILFAVWVALATVSSTQKGVMIWQDKLRASAVCEISGELMGLATALVALTQGLGVFALVLGRLSYQLMHLAISFSITRMAPLPGMTGEARRGLLVYSGQYVASRITVTLRLYAATFLIGGFLGPAAVGYYRAAERLVAALSEFVFAPAQLIAWTIFRKARDNDGGFQKCALVFFHFLYAFGLPVFLWLAISAEDLIVGFLGETWLPALPVVTVLALARAMQLQGVTNEPLFSLSGNIRLLPRLTLTILAISVTLTSIGGHFGLTAVAWAQVAISLTSILIMGRALHRHAGIMWRPILRRASGLVVPLALGTVALYLARQSAVMADLPVLVRAVAASFVAMAVYAVVLVIFDGTIRGMLRRALAQRVLAAGS